MTTQSVTNGQHGLSNGCYGFLNGFDGSANGYNGLTNGRNGCNHNSETNNSTLNGGHSAGLSKGFANGTGPHVLRMANGLGFKSIGSRERRALSSPVSPPADLPFIQPVSAKLKPIIKTDLANGQPSRAAEDSTEPKTSSPTDSTSTLIADSVPMESAFMVSAPGKVIVFGEHAVVHGKAAIAASVSLRSYLLVSKRSKPDGTITLKFPDINFDHSWNIDDLPWDLFSRPDKKKHYHDVVTELDPELVAAIEPHTADVSPHIKSEKERKIHQSSAGAFLYMFLMLGDPDWTFRGTHFTLRSTIPIGAGLGSSATIAVCLATALLRRSDALAGPRPNMPSNEARIQLERINSWAYVYEMFIHGNPSGVDNTVATQGKALHFRRPDYKKRPEVEPIWSFPKLPLLLVNTKVEKSTKNLVSKVKERKEELPEVVEPILDAIGMITDISQKFLEPTSCNKQPMGSQGLRRELLAINDHLMVSLKASEAQLQRAEELEMVEPIAEASKNILDAYINVSKTSDCDLLSEESRCRLLGELMSTNHCLLKALGVSHERLERVRELVDKRGIGWTKLTGAGGGGCSITLLKPGVSRETLNDLETELEKEGYQRFESTLGGDGVGVLDPVILGKPGENDHGAHIDLNQFLSAKGNEGIERLVGVRGKEGERMGWKFWRIDSGI